MVVPGEVISYLEMCREEGVNFQRGMNYRNGSLPSVILMSRQQGAPYDDRIVEEGRVLIYDWDFPTLAHVWHYQGKAIMAGADRLESLSTADRARSLEALGDRVRTLVRALDDSWLVATAVFMVEDLYKSFFREFRWSSGVADYIADSAGVFMHEFTERGFVLNYVVDNTESEADLAEMLTYVPEVFRAAGLPVVGPQLMALEVTERIEGRPRDVGALPSTIDEGQYLAEQFVTRCHKDRQSYVYLNLQPAEDNSRLPLDISLSNADAPGTLVIFRNQPPAAGTTVEVSAPPGVTMPTV